MQYTQQQRLAPEVPDESALYSPILNSQLAQTTADGCVHTTDTTQLDFAVGNFVLTRRDCRQLRIPYTPPTQLS